MFIGFPGFIPETLASCLFLCYDGKNRQEENIMKTENKWSKINLWVAVPLIMQIAIAAMMLWGFFGDAWRWSWLCPYIGVILSLELFFYNSALKEGKHPVKALYPIVIMLGFAFFFTGGFAANGWSWSWIGLALAAAGIGIVLLIDRSVSKK